MSHSPPASHGQRHAAHHGPRGRLDILWAHTSTRIVAAVGAATTSGLASALSMPRGPVTSTHAMTLMALGLLTGVAAGFVMRSRWAMLLATVAHVAAFEFARIGEAGPTVDGIHLGTTFGIMAFIFGRGVYGILALPPMLLGIVWGKRSRRPWSMIHWPPSTGPIACDAASKKG